MRTFLIFLFVAVVSLIVYNPEMDDFKSYIENTFHEQQLKEQTSVINQMFSKERETASPRLTPPSTYTERNNYLIFSTYKISLVEKEKYLDPLESRYLGIASMFFEIGHSGSTETLIP